MNVLQAIHSRRAVRDFTSEPVSEGMLYQLVSAAGWAPSAMNEQPWHFTIVTDAAVLDEISGRAKAWLLQSVSLRPRAGHFRDIFADPSFHLFYHAPALVIVSAPATTQWVKEDCALAAQNLMLIATDLKLGSCWIGFAQDWLNTPEARGLLNLSESNLAVAPIIVGHPKTLPPTVGRKPPQVTWLGHQLDRPGLSDPDA